jgi:hypothetical protein
MIVALTPRERSHDGFIERLRRRIGRARIEPFSPVVWSCSCGLAPPPPGRYAETFIFRDWHWGDGRRFIAFALRDPDVKGGRPRLIGFEQRQEGK